MAQIQLALPGFDGLEDVKASAAAGCVECERYLAWRAEAYRAHAYNLEIINRMRDKCEEAGIDWEAWLVDWEPETPDYESSSKGRQSKTANAALRGGEAVPLESTVMHRSNNDT